MRLAASSATRAWIPSITPEFTTIELYQAFTDFHGMMDLVEELYKRLAQKICGSMVIPYQGKQIDMGTGSA